MPTVTYYEARDFVPLPYILANYPTRDRDVEATATSFTLRSYYENAEIIVTGQGFEYDAGPGLSAGTVTGIAVRIDGVLVAEVSDLSRDADAFNEMTLTFGSPVEAYARFLGDEGTTFVGSTGSDDMWGSDGDDVFRPGGSGSRGSDSVLASRGDDTIVIEDGFSGWLGLGYHDFDMLLGAVDVNIDVAAGTATVEQGRFGLDRVTNIGAALTADGVGVYGSTLDDTFTIAGATDPADPGYILIRGGEGSDTYDVTGDDTVVLVFAGGTEGAQLDDHLCVLHGIPGAVQLLLDDPPLDLGPVGRAARPLHVAREPVCGPRGEVAEARAGGGACGDQARVFDPRYRLTDTEFAHNRIPRR